MLTAPLRIYSINCWFPSLPLTTEMLHHSRSSFSSGCFQVCLYFISFLNFIMSHADLFKSSFLESGPPESVDWCHIGSRKLSANTTFDLFSLWQVKNRPNLLTESCFYLFHISYHSYFSAPFSLLLTIISEFPIFGYCISFLEVLLTYMICFFYADM